jgi:GTPase SAR1 family protein
MRKMAYYDTDVFLIVFDISNRKTFEHVESVWVPELEACEEADLTSGKPQLVLVGTKSDIRVKPVPGRDCVSTDEGQACAARIGAAAYFDTSAIRKTNIEEAFQCVMR